MGIVMAVLVLLVYICIYVYISTLPLNLAPLGSDCMVAKVLG